MTTPRNLVKKFRQAKSLSQRKLAELCSISQQHIQRIEAGIAPARLDVALHISEALGVPVAKVFPAFAAVVKKFPGRKLQSEAAKNQLDDAGIETEGVVWTAVFGLKGGASQNYSLSSADMRKLERDLRDFHLRDSNEPAPQFFCFNSSLYRVCVNLDALSLAQTMFDAPGVTPECALDDKAHYAVLVWIKGRDQPEKFGADFDDEEEDEEGFPGGQLNFLMEILAGACGEDSFVSFEDVDGENVFLRMSEIGLLAIPHILLKPELLNELDDDIPAPNGKYHRSKGTARAQRKQPGAPPLEDESERKQGRKDAKEKKPDANHSHG